MKIIAHRGILDYKENSVMGILVALQKLERVEFDVLFVKDKWVLCHDIKSYNDHCEPFSALIETIQSARLTKGQIIVDIKWDSLYNKKQSFQDKLNTLSAQIPVSMVDTFHWWFQVSSFQQVEDLIQSPLKGRKGVIVEDMPPKEQFGGDYFMIDISKFTPAEIKTMSRLYPSIIMMGYTCPSPCLLKYFSSYPISYLIIDLHLKDLFSWK